MTLMIDIEHAQSSSVTACVRPSLRSPYLTIVLTSLADKPRPMQPRRHNDRSHRLHHQRPRLRMDVRPLRGRRCLDDSLHLLRNDNGPEMEGTARGQEGWRVDLREA